MPKILVTYASRTGSTVGVAEVIGQTLLESGVEVDVRPMEEVKDLRPYGVIVAGSSIRDGKWLPEAMEFVRANQQELLQKPFALFVVCMTLAMKNADSHQAVKAWLQPVRALVNPVSEGYFAGVLNIKKVPTLRQRLMFQVSVAIGVWSEGDHRDWNAIRTWAKDLAAQIQPETS